MSTINEPAIAGEEVRVSKTQMLPCKLTGPEREARGIELAERIAVLVRLREAKKEAAAAAKVEIDLVEEGVLDMGIVVRDGAERRPVEVIERFDVKARQVLTLRTDTFDEVSSRAMTVAEYEEHAQLKIFAHEGGAPAKPTDELAPPEVDAPKRRRGKKTEAEAPEADAASA